MITWNLPKVISTVCASVILLSMFIDGLKEKFRKKNGRICQEETRDSRE